MGQRTIYRFMWAAITALCVAAPLAASAQGILSDIAQKGFSVLGGDQGPAPQLPPKTWKPEDPFTRSLLFSQAEIAAIRRAIEDAKNRGDKEMTPGVAAAAAAVVDEVKKAPVEPIPMHRTISVSGVVFRSKDDWIVWLNGTKVTPKKLLPEIVDIAVEKEQVHLKWFDKGINGIISISLRPHQTYDIVTGVLLPG